MATIPPSAERRVFITRHHEYHLRGKVCVAVRDRATGQWVEDHAAIGKELIGSVRLRDDVRHSAAHAVQPGERLAFGRRPTERLLTSEVEVAQRKDGTLQGYVVNDPMQEIAPPAGDRER